VNHSDNAEIDPSRFPPMFFHSPHGSMTKKYIAFLMSSVGLVMQGSTNAVKAIPYNEQMVTKFEKHVPCIREYICSFQIIGFIDLHTLHYSNILMYIQS
jgi:hypothetical protein